MTSSALDFKWIAVSIREKRLQTPQAPGFFRLDRRSRYFSCRD
jgi:hypothetical protein